MEPQKGEWPAKLSIYIEIDDIDAYTERVKRAGGKMFVEKMEVPEVGYRALFEDPNGRVLGMWERLES